VGLIQRAIEEEGIPTISVSLNRTITEKVKPPRALLVKFPLGHPLGEPFNEWIQRKILTEGLKYLKEIERPGMIVDLNETNRKVSGKSEICRVDKKVPCSFQAFRKGNH
jgi:D-proline reductase (dithiol) PrdB